MGNLVCNTNQGLCQPPDQIDFEAPTIAGATTVEPAVGRVGTEFTVSFTVSEALLLPPELSFSGVTAQQSLSLASVDGLNYQYRYTSSGPDVELEGIAQIQAELIDQAGNRNRLLLSSPLSFDFRAPQPFTDTVRVELLADAGNLRRSVTSATDGTRIRVSFTTDEIIAAPSAVPVRFVLGEGEGATSIALTASTATATGFVFERQLDSATIAPDGSYRLELTLTDAAGNTGDYRFADRVTIDRTTPRVPRTDLPGALVHERRPWGDGTDPEPRFVLNWTDATQIEEGGAIVVFDRADISSAQRLGSSEESTAVPPDGFAGQIVLAREDLPAVYVTTVDRAGNVGDADPSTPALDAARVPDGRWTAALNALGTVTSPHQVTIAPERPAHPTDSQDDSIVSGSDAIRLGLNDNNPLVVSGEDSEWRVVVPRSRSAAPAISQAAAATDTTNDRVVLFGGFTETMIGMNNVRRQLDQTWQWDDEGWTRLSFRGEPPTRRQSARMSEDRLRGRLVLFGGRFDNGPTNDTYELDGNRWIRFPGGANAPPLRSDFGLAYDSRRGVTVLYGGQDASGPCFADLWEWDGIVWTPVSAAGGPGSRCGPSMVTDPQGDGVLVFGGNRESGNCGSNGTLRCRDLWRWDGVAWQLVSDDPMVNARTGAVFVVDEARSVAVLSGGTSCDGGCNNTWEWDGLSWTRTSDGAGNPVAAGAAAAYLDSVSSLVALGGGTGTDEFFLYSGDRWATITIAEDSILGRSSSGATWLGDEQAFLIHGGADGACFDGIADFCDETIVWRDGSARNLPAGAPGRTSLGLAWDSVLDRVVLFGGFGDGSDCTPLVNFNDCRDTWAFSLLDNTWTDLTPGSISATNSPPGLSNVSMTFDVARSEAVLFGGSTASGACTSSFCDQTWTLSGTSWNRKTPTTSPQPRIDATMTYDSLRDRVLLFGGRTNDRTGCPPEFDDGFGCVLNDLWAWDGNDWTDITPTTGSLPPARVLPLLVYDDSRDRVIMSGGVTFINGFDCDGREVSNECSWGDTWEFNGTAWVQAESWADPIFWPIVPPFGFDATNKRTLVLNDNIVIERISPASRTPGIQITLDVSTLGVPSDSLLGGRVRAWTAATSFVGNPGERTASGAAVLDAWRADTGEWSELGRAANAILEMPIQNDSPAAAAQAWVGSDSTIDLRLSPGGLGSDDNVPATVSLDAAELTLIYRWGEGRVCGDGNVDLGEECDDGVNDGTACTGTCRLP